MEIPMGARGRKSITELESAALKLVPPRPLQPPRGMPRAQRAVWREVTSSFGVDFFSEADRPLLNAYCHAATQAERLAAVLEKEGVLIDTAGGRMTIHPASYALSNATATMCRIAGKLRICPSARFRADASATRASVTPSTRRPWST
jgi:P27 family predicted phage terminase small subunit